MQGNRCGCGIYHLLQAKGIGGGGVEGYWCVSREWGEREVVRRKCRRDTEAGCLWGGRVLCRDNSSTSYQDPWGKYLIKFH